MFPHDVVYMPQLKWKAGEIRALGTLPTPFADRTLPVLKITPGGGFDAIEERVLSTVENISLFGRRLTLAWGRRLAFIDAELIDGEQHSRGLKQHPLTELLERARLVGACAGPLVRLASSAAYKEAVKRYCEREAGAPICLCVSLSELETLPSLDALRTTVGDLGTMTERTVLLIDAGPIHVAEPAAFVQLLAGHLGRLAPRGAWLRTFWGATTFPNKPKLKAGDVGRFPRGDWLVYKSIIESADEFASLPLFSDYALEYPSDYTPVRVPPTAHFRYSTQEDYLIFKGATTRKPNGYAAIFPVADRAAASGDFMGKGYSAGDAYIEALTRPGARTGNASIWRWASTDHHFRIVHSGLQSALALPIETSVPTISQEQLLLV
ncbi:MAG TPA: hypothetical protein VEZ20_05725 [Allosphingosinicella sp.]|jgi:hypothetical protein|nr:hypothetical protein [Allosphingosinicella sp.]